MRNNQALAAVIDAGTTGTRCCIIDMFGKTVSEGYCSVPTLYPKPGLAEQDPVMVIDLTFRAVREAIVSGNIDPSWITGLCVTVQRNSFAPIKADGSFLGNMIIWQDQRGEEAHSWILERLKCSGITPEAFYQINGQPFSSFQCGFKALWFRRFREDQYNQTYKLVTPQAFLTHAFGADGYTEENNNQSFWLVADADRQQIDENLCRIFDIRADVFPDAVSPGTMIGAVSKEASERSGLLAGTPIFIGSGDQNCGALGAGNYGTSDIISVCMGTAGLCIAYSPVPVRHPRAMCQIQGHPAGGYLMESHSSSCMSSYRWAGDIFCGNARGIAEEMKINALMENAAGSVPAGANGVFFLPWLQGAACPHYDDSARGAYVGMSLATGKNDMIRATMEGICFENRMMLETLMEADIAKAKTLRIVGGASNSDLWNQMQADIYGLPVETVRSRQSAALGAAVICSVASGVYGSFREAVDNMVHVKQKFIPEAGIKQKYDELYRIWDGCYTDLSRNSFHHIYDFQRSLR